MLVSSIQKTHSHAIHLRVPFFISPVASVNDNLENIVCLCDYITNWLHFSIHFILCNFIVRFDMFIFLLCFPASKDS